MVNAIPERNLPVLILGAFHSTKTSGLFFSATSSTKTTYENNLPKFSKFFPGSFFVYELSLLEFLELSVEWLAFRKFNSFQNFWKLFREISVPFAVSSKGGFIIAIAFACWNLLLFLGSKTIKNFSRQIFESLG